ncbi:6-phosphogluconolactonase [Acetonema longum]|uniref:6-phosphogluconolactonase n=1 Tax=Acetonema longum DSM 6540 TaxID=1009370 RepID=F7NJ55_9FIRM|nr:6-phosphogluconolactonase [Acetonema longum]EGO63945.1 6-phosphogluconolactonase [Acetonema longum DSM 6540]
MNYTVYQNLEDLSQVAAAAVSQAARRCVEDKGYFTLVLAGGNTPRTLYRILAEQESQIPWPRVYIFWGDERFVPPNHDDSNYRMAHQTLLSRVKIPSGQVYPVPTETATPEQAADAYEARIKTVMTQLDSPGLKWPVFDFILLGVGADGHTASLFPGDPSLNETRRWVCGARGPNGAPRVTLTLPVLNAARQVLFLATGADKQRVIGEILSPEAKNMPHYPAQRVRGDNAAWLLDREAAGKLY